MQRISSKVRPNLDQVAKENGFEFHVIDNETYWDESHYYQFTLNQIENDIEDPTAEIHAMAMDCAAEIFKDEQHLQTLGLPFAYWDYVANSFKQKDPFLYGRIDLAYNGTGPAKLYEFNYDTPTSLYEAAYFQWLWLEDAKKSGLLAENTDQYNLIQEKLIERFASINPDKTMYFASTRGHNEDIGTTEYIRDCATQAGLTTQFICLEDIGLDQSDQFIDLDYQQINHIFKLYPWEFMFEEEFASFLPLSNTRWIEPSWKWVLSNKGFLAFLWHKNKGHPNLLETHIEDNSQSQVASGWVRKQFLSREGANITLNAGSGKYLVADGPYAGHKTIRQACHLLPDFDGNFPVIGSWVVGDEAVGIGIREDLTLITQDTSRFVPHCIID